jgi:hypothetical protein
MVIARDKYVYTGGAHGIQTREYYVVELENYKALAVEDLFQEPAGDGLRKLITEELRRYGGLDQNQPLSEGIFFEDSPEMSKNFFLTEEGIGFHWDPYEIAPYSEGHIEIILPWHLVSPLLRHEGIELLTGFGIYLFM